MVGGSRWQQCQLSGSMFRRHPVHCVLALILQPPRSTMLINTKYYASFKALLEFSAQWALLQIKAPVTSGCMQIGALLLRALPKFIHLLIIFIYSFNHIYKSTFAYVCHFRRLKFSLRYTLFTSIQLLPLHQHGHQVMNQRYLSHGATVTGQHFMVQ